jgi:tRNA-dihydrouridine synthase
MHVITLVSSKMYQTQFSGESSKKVNAIDLVPLLERAGAAAVTIHGRTMEQRYKRPADWHIITNAAQSVSMPVIGNGDLLTCFEVAHRRKNACHALMIGRGALIKPWIFEEAKFVGSKLSSVRKQCM